jgi:aspartate racemase
MKTIGLIGGTSWVSTLEYYRMINQSINEKMSGMFSGKILLYSVNHEEFIADAETDWDEVSEKLSSIAKMLEHAGADCLLICANTMHMAADYIRRQIKIPLIHITEETAKKVKKQHLNKVGLIGTQTTMEYPFFKKVLSDFGIDTLIPAKEDREYIQSTIFSELSKGIFRKETKEGYKDILNRLILKGAEGIILGCTEIPLLIKEGDCTVPAFDTTAIHANAAVYFALNNDKN